MRTTSSRRIIEAQFTRNPALPGVELRRVMGVREWGFCSQDYQLLFCRDWTGNVWHQRAEFVLSPGTVLVAAPNQLIVTRKSNSGTLMCLTLDRSLVAAWSESMTAELIPGRRHLSPASTELLFELTSRLPEAQYPAHLEASVGALLGAVSSPPPPAGVTDGGQKPPSPFDSREDVAFDLRSLSEQLGTSRFSALRAFKRHFGLPPHNYQLHLRVERAQAGLRAGLSPARVAVECGFFDQSHLTRHFKKVLGTTPAQYARACRPEVALAASLLTPVDASRGALLSAPA